MTHERRKGSERTCSDCSKPIGKANKSGRCRACAVAFINSSPEIAARRVTSIRKAYQDPALRRLVGENKRKDWAAHPEWRKELSARAKALQPFKSPKCIAARADPEVQARAAEAISRTRLTMVGIPLEYREMYLRLMRNPAIKAERAQEMVHEHIEAEQRRAREDKCARIAVTHASIAADFLRRFTWVYRKGDGWQLGTVTLTPAQLVDRALRRGWQPEDWSVAA